MDRQKVGNQFEQEIATLLKFRQTVNSGAMFHDADLRPENGKPVIAEAKLRRTSGAISGVARTDVEKLKRQAEKIGKDWIYAVRGKSGESYVICDLNFFAEATEEFFRVRK